MSKTSKKMVETMADEHSQANASLIWKRTCSATNTENVKNSNEKAVEREAQNSAKKAKKPVKHKIEFEGKNKSGQVKLNQKAKVKQHNPKHLQSNNNATKPFVQDEGSKL